MNNRQFSKRERLEKKNSRNMIETPMGTPVQQMWQVLKVHEERITQLSLVVEKILVRLDKTKLVENNNKINSEITILQSNILKLQEQINNMEKENSV